MHGSWFQRNLTTNHPESKLALPSWLNRGGEGLTTSLALIPARTYIHHWFVLIGTKSISVHHPHPQWLLTHLTRPHTHLQKCERAHKCLPLHLSRTHTHSLTCICSRHSVVTRTTTVIGCWKGVTGIATKAGVTGTVARRCSLTMGVCDLLWQCLVTWQHAVPHGWYYLSCFVCPDLEPFERINEFCVRKSPQRLSTLRFESSQSCVAVVHLYTIYVYILYLFIHNIHVCIRIYSTRAMLSEVFDFWVLSCFLFA